jgi:hypothetical protein
LLWIAVVGGRRRVESQLRRIAPIAIVGRERARDACNALLICAGNT